MIIPILSLTITVGLSGTLSIYWVIYKQLAFILKFLSLSFSDSFTIWAQAVVLALPLATQFVQKVPSFPPHILQGPALVTMSATFPSPTARIGQLAHARSTRWSQLGALFEGLQ